MKFLAASGPAAAASAAGSLPSGRRTKLRAGLPVGAELVVFLALAGVAEDFVGLVDFLELGLGVFLVFGDVGVELAGELAESLLDVGLAGVTGDAEGLVIIFIADGHR